SYSSSKNDIDPNEKDVKEDDLYIPAGSIFTGVLINGMDAPTAQGARQDPFPATLRISKEAILPNRFRADVRECFLIVSGHGDLSSERAYLRGETLSCIKDNGEVIETGFNSYAVGEDGKAGVRGRLVSKQGQIIAKSLMAGFLSGAAEAFDVNAVPTLNLSNTGKTQYQQNDFSNTFVQGAAAKGASSALDRVAQFYVQMAEGIFPVIEIDAGRQVDIIVTKGSALKVRGSKVK
ncbi:TraB/VirB10 family protein, partial [uncultured Pseudoalteromonas sp.]|uniref:TraB/VirB10 family protein n=1 Tax=uncultured Pseudoalteromonas sp. TaxID=114053 RepID=UPI0025927C2F